MEHHLILGQNPTASTGSIPKQSMMMVKEVTTETETGLLLSNDNNKVCDVCGKGFGNAKILNGHMRVHFHPRCSFNASNLGVGEFSSKHRGGVRRLKIKRKVSSDDQRGRAVVMVGSEACPVCGKGFGSEKALYGHMRCHSGRGWRGMVPPTTPPLTASTRRANLESSLSHSDDDHDGRFSPRSLGDSIKVSSNLSWSRKGKRGQYPFEKLRKKGHGFGGGGDVDLMMWNAADKLLELGRYRTDQEETSLMEVKRRRLIRNAFLPDDSECGKTWFEEFDEYIREKRWRKAIFLDSVKPEWDSDDEYYLSNLLPVGWDTDFDIRVDHHRDLFDPSAGMSPSSLCSSSAHVPKLISSQNHHKKMATMMKGKMKKFDPQLHDRSLEGPAASQDASASADDDEEEEETHPAGVFKCRHCPKKFATGQALGGHQRAHYVPGGFATMPETASASTWSQDDQDSDSGGRKGLLLFDFNEPATNEEEADETDQ